MFRLYGQNPFLYPSLTFGVFCFIVLLLFCTAAISLIDRLQEAHVAVQRRNARFLNCKKFINLCAVTEVVVAQGDSYRRFVVEDVESCDRFDSPVLVLSADVCLGYGKSTLSGGPSANPSPSPMLSV